MDKESEEYREHIKLKYDDNYFKNNYTIVNGIVIRRPDNLPESQSEKAVCLSQCFYYFTKCYIVEASSEFQVVLHKSLGQQTRCCCSQKEDDGLRYKIIKHRETGLEFVIGRVCFEKLFDDEKDKLKHFFQPNCKYCDKKVKRNMLNTPTQGFCGIKCLKEYNEREEKIRLKKIWDDGEPKREAKRIARLAQLEAERLARLAELEEEEKRKVEKKIKFPFGEWFNCQGCNVEKKTDFERKYKWCKKCGKK